jgi:SAM-dependent methyltransferase
VLQAEKSGISVAKAGYSRQPVMVIDPAIESHYGTGYERSRLFPGGRPSLEYVRSMELLDRLLPRPPARLLDVGGGPGTFAGPLARRGYRVHLVDPVPLHIEQARQAAGTGPAAAFTAALGDARKLAEPPGCVAQPTPTEGRSSVSTRRTSPAQNASPDSERQIARG